MLLSATLITIVTISYFTKTKSKYYKDNDFKFSTENSEIFVKIYENLM